MRTFLICLYWFISSTRAGLLTNELSPPTGSSYYTGYGQPPNINTGNYNIQSPSNTYYNTGSTNIATLGFATPLHQSHFAPLIPTGGSTTSISHQIQSVPFAVPQPYPVTVQHNVPVPVPIVEPVYKPRPVQVDVLKPYAVSVPKLYPVAVKHPVYVKVPLLYERPAHFKVNSPITSPSLTNTEFSYGNSFGFFNLGQQSHHLSGNEYSTPHVSINTKYTPISSYSNRYPYNVQTKYTHRLHGGLIDSLKTGRYTVYKDIGQYSVGGGVNLADITIPQQYDADGGYKY